MKNIDVFGSLVKDPAFKTGKKVSTNDLIAAIDRIYDKRYPVVPNARKSNKVDNKKK